MGCVGARDVKLPLEKKYSVPLSEHSPGFKLRILHFNDTYNIQEDDGKGGAARFVTALDHYRKEVELQADAGLFNADTLTLFSGDMLGPSLISSVCEGEQLIKPFNSMKIDAACLGNHELDFGVDQLANIVTATSGTCSWICSNMEVKGSKKGLAGTKKAQIIEKGSMVIGLIGISEQEWFETFNDLDEEVNFLNEQQTATKLAKELRELGCNMIIALTHQWTKNDEEIAVNVPGVDLVLGGHDHIKFSQAYQNKNTPNKDIPLIKSGHDFHDLSVIDISFGIDKDKKEEVASNDDGTKVMYSEPDKMLFEISTINVDDKGFEPHAETAAHADAYMKDLNERMNVNIGYAVVEMESRKQVIRTQETNFPNFLADLFRTEYTSDFGFINMGGIRLNDVMPVGTFTHLTMKEMLPYPDNIILLSMPGSIVKEALEKSVSMYPEAEGHWLAVSGLKFTFDPSKPVNERIDAADILLPSGKPIDLAANYKVAVNSYVGQGGDGFECFEKEEVKTLVDPENTLQVLDLCIQFFKRTEANFKVKPINKARRDLRFKIFNNEAGDKCPEGKWIMLRP